MKIEMNIFYLHRKRKKCVKYHVDKHVIKMILETAQLLCTAIWIMGGEAPYKKTHVNHPCTIWARKSKHNWIWLRRFGLYLCKEYTYRYGKIHKTQKILEQLKCPNLPVTSFTEPPQCMPEEYKVEGNTVQAYRNYYNGEKRRMFSWKGKINGRKIPSWIIN